MSKDRELLDLVVKLGLDVDVHRGVLGSVPFVEVRGYAYRRLLVTEWATDNEESLMMAMRRAIMSAAIVVGERMPLPPSAAA